MSQVTLHVTLWIYCCGCRPLQQVPSLSTTPPAWNAKSRHEDYTASSRDATASKLQWTPLLPHTVAPSIWTLGMPEFACAVARCARVSSVPPRSPAKQAAARSHVGAPPTCRAQARGQVELYARVRGASSRHCRKVALRFVAMVPVRFASASIAHNVTRSYSHAFSDRIFGSDGSMW